MSDQAGRLDASCPSHVLAIEADSDRQYITVDEQKGSIGHVGLRQQYARERRGGRVGRTTRDAQQHKPWGIDVLAGDLNGRAAIWQAKYFIDGVRPNQYKEIRES